VKAITVAVCCTEITRPWLKEQLRQSRKLTGHQGLGGRAEAEYCEMLSAGGDEGSQGEI